jgi:hypothetical protein
MTVVWVVVVVLVAIAIALLSAGLLEVYVQLEQVRTVLRMQDRPTPVHLATLGSTLQELLPDLPESIRRAARDSAAFHVLVLSSSCAVCQVIGAGLGTSAEALRGTVAVLVAAEHESAAQRFVSRANLPPEMVTVDVLGRQAKRLGVDQSPTVVSVVDGRLRAAANLASFRQLEIFCERERDEAAMAEVR